MEHKLFINHKSNATRRKWFTLLIIGLITYIMGLGVLIYTENVILFPAVVMLGNFLIPVTYVSFFYERRRKSSITMSDTVASFFYGGFLGTFAASILEPVLIRTLLMDINTALMIGVVEEFAKMLGVAVILRHKRHNLAMDGIILGASAGMGFAALESCGYAFNAFLGSGGNLSYTVYITMLRGILSPLGHGTWTAILSGVLVRENASNYFRLNFKVLVAYVVVVLLHGLWDGLPWIFSGYVSSGTAISAGEAVVGTLGIAILMKF